jgi:hypothetical protein
MATPKFDIISIALSKVMGDEVTAATSAGNLFTQAVRENAINRARGTIFTQILMKAGLTQFIDQYPEFVSLQSLTFATPAGTVAVPAGVRKVLKIYYNALVAEPVPAELILDAKYNTYSKWKGTTAKPVFLQYNNILEILGFVSGTTAATGLVLNDPVDIASAGANDIIEPYTWLDMIVMEAANILLKTQQISEG